MYHTSYIDRHLLWYLSSSNQLNHNWCILFTQLEIIKKDTKDKVEIFFIFYHHEVVSRNSFNEYLISKAAVCLHYLQEHQQHHKKALPFCPPMIPDDRQLKDENDEEVEEIIRDDTNRPQPNQSPDINQDRNILYQISQDEVRLISKFVNNVRISFIHY